MIRKRFNITPVGGSTLIIFFAVLTLVTFALLSLSTSRADLRLTDAMVESNIAYYRADCKGEELLAQLRQGTVPDGVSNLGGGKFGFDIPITDNIELQIEVTVNADNGSYTIHRWQEVNNE